MPGRHTFPECLITVKSADLFYKMVVNQCFIQSLGHGAGIGLAEVLLQIEGGKEIQFYFLFVKILFLGYEKLFNFVS